MRKKISIVSALIILILILGLLNIKKSPTSPTVPSSIPQSTITPSFPTPQNIAPQSEPPSPSSTPRLTEPLPYAKLTSPQQIKGSVPPGWMFEGVFPIKLLDQNRKLILQTQAKEVTPGSWNSGKTVEFRAILNFSTTAKSGFLILERDNPSGLPENADSFEIPVTF